MSEPQSIQPNTWTPLLGSDVEILVDGVNGAVRVEAEEFRSDKGEQLVEFRLAIDSGPRIALRAPKADVTWLDTTPVDNP